MLKAPVELLCSGRLTDIESPCAHLNGNSDILTIPSGNIAGEEDFAPDTLTNNELGWKTIWMDRRIQWDGAIYQEDWNQTQVGLYGLGVINYGVTQRW
jgi:outer membrane receptor for monomeric catechols